MSNFDDTYGWIMGLPGREAGSADPWDQAADIASALADWRFAQLSPQQQLDFVRRAVALYHASSHRSAGQVAASLHEPLARWLDEDTLSLPELIEVYDLLYFLYWCANHDLDQQRPFASEVAKPIADAMARLRPPQVFAQPIEGRPLKVAYLAQFCTRAPGNALGLVAEDVVRGLASRSDLAIHLYAWFDWSAEFLDATEADGVTVRRITASTQIDRVEAVAEQLRLDAIDVVLTDMNSGAPTCLFVGGCAPVQIYYQLGMPFWPLSRLDGVILGWDGPRDRLGFDRDDAHHIPLPWSLAKLSPAVNPEAIERERGRFPSGRRIVGTYGRLAKITDAYLDVARRVLEAHPDVIVAVGGSGDGRRIREFVADHGLQDRFVLIDTFVEGHLWGHILDVFIDTWPLVGGIAVREVTAKGKPVAAILSRDMPNLSRERDPALLAADPDELVTLVDRLLTDRAFYGGRCAAALDLAAGGSSVRTFGDEIATFIHGTVDRVRRRTAE